MHNIILATSQIPGWLSTNEGLFLTKASRVLIKLKGEVVEIGSYHGKSTLYLASSNKMVYAIDPHKGDLDKRSTSPTLRSLKSNLKKNNLDSNVTIITKSSEEAAKNWTKSIKLLFIDALHDYENATRDYSLWEPHLVENGIIAMHDAFCGWIGVYMTVDENIFSSQSFKQIGVVGSIIYAVKGTPNLMEKLTLTKNILIIRISHAINQLQLPKTLKFLLIHRVLKIFLLNRFTLFRT